MIKKKNIIITNRNKEIAYIIVLQYLLTIVSTFVAIVLWLINLNALGFAICVIQLIVAMSSNCCSVACTLAFLDKNIEDKGFQPQRTIIIVVSLAANVLVNIFFQYKVVDLNYYQQRRLLILIGLIVLFISIWLIRIQRTVESRNNTLVSEYICNNADEARKLEKAVVDNEEIILEEPKYED